MVEPAISALAGPITITVAVAFTLSSYVAHPAGLVATVCILYAVFHASQWLIHGFNTDDQQVWLSLKRKHFSGAAE